MTEPQKPLPRETSQGLALSQNMIALTAPQKAAVIIALLGAENAGPVVEKIEDKHLRAFLAALESLRQIPRETMLGAVADFITELKLRSGGLKGGPDVARKMAEALFASERVEKILGAKPSQSINYPTDSVWADLKVSDSSELATYLGRQRGDVISIILSQFSTDKAGEILAELPEEISFDCVNQLSRQKIIEPRTLDAVAELVNIEFLSQNKVDKLDSSVSFISEVLSILPKERRDTMLETLEKEDPEQADKIRKSMMTFEDLPQRLPATAIPILFRDFDQDKLLKTLKTGADQGPATIEFLYANISQRMAEQFKEQVEELKTFTQKDGDSAISGFMGFIGKLEKEGRITLIKPEPEPE